MNAGNRLHRALFGAAIVAAILYLIASDATPHSVDVVLKTSMCVLLAALALMSRARWLAVALLFSACGDALLAIDGAKLFVPALASFLVTHVLYAMIFICEIRRSPVPINGWRTIVIPLPVMFAAIYTVLIWPHLGALSVPVVLYIAAIVAMTVLSIRVLPVIITIGAVLFMASDSLIAYEKFLSAPSWVGPLVWISYAAAQPLITHGILRAPQRSQVRSK